MVRAMCAASPAIASTSVPDASPAAKELGKRSGKPKGGRHPPTKGKPGKGAFYYDVYSLVRGRG